MIEIKDGLIFVNGKDTSLVLIEENNNIGILNFGEKITDIQSSYVLHDKLKNHASFDDNNLLNRIFSFSGDTSNREPLVLFTDENGLFINRFSYNGWTLEQNEIHKGLMPFARNKQQTIKFEFVSLTENLSVFIRISCFEDSSIFSFSTEIVNKSCKKIFVQRLMSVQIDLFGKKAEITSFDGTYLRERQINKSLISNGVYVIDSKCGFSSSTHNPFFILKNFENYYGFNLIWSGNHKQIIEVSSTNRIRIMSGMNDYCFSYPICKGENLISPEALVICAKNRDTITSEMHNFTLNHIIPPNFKDVERPILLNNWEATYYSFTSEKLLELANKAKMVGIELFVLDDGWFGNRNNDKSSLGDWFDNKNKTGGLQELKQELKKLGLKFGLWLEPEMVSPDSELFKNNPEFAMTIPDLQPIEQRNQYILDFANENVVNYIFNILNKLLKEISPDYIKWDCNRIITDAYSKALEYQGGYYYKYITGLYKLLEKLKNEFPNILFEGCAGGGNRFDLGILFYMPQNWCSDNTDALDREAIQNGTLYAYPQSTLGAHVSATPNHQTGRDISIEDRFNIACVGAFGYELDLTKLDEQTLNIVKNQIEYYKAHRKLLQFGNYYRLKSENLKYISGFIIVSKDKKEAMAFIISKECDTNGENPGISLGWLNPDYVYEIEMRSQSNCQTIKNFIAKGDVLNNVALNLGELINNSDCNNSKYISSRMLYLKKV